MVFLCRTHVKLIKQLTFFVLFLTIFASCDNEGEYIDTGFVSYSVRFSMTQGIGGDYEIRFNGETCKNSSIIGKKGSIGKLEVFEKESGELAFSKDIALDENTTIELIKTVEGGIDILSDKNMCHSPQ